MLKLLVFLIFISTLAEASFRFSKNQSYVIYAEEETTSEIKEDVFFQVTSDILNLYTGRGKVIIANLDWKYPYMSAWANKNGEVFSINFWGGFARIPIMTLSTWEFIVCHEIGHIIGGHPMQTIKDYDWASSEGQSDHFAVTECLPHYYSSLKGFLEREFVSTPLELDKCLTEDPLKQQTCLSILAGARGFAGILKYMKLAKDKPHFETPAPRTENLIRNSYPTPQCRMDIAFNATDCLFQKTCFRSDCWFVD